MEAKREANVRIDSSDGYTIIELLVITAIIGVLASVGMVRLHEAPDGAIVAALRSDLRSLVAAQEVHQAEHGHYASSVEALGDEVRLSKGVEVRLDASGAEWSAQASHPAVSVVCRAGRDVDGLRTPQCREEDALSEG